MPRSNELMEQSPQESQADLGSDRVSQECEPASDYDKPTIRKVDESRHGDFWCD